MGKQQQLRVHILAKELGVSSKAIIDKCRAEGIVLNNHMATLSAGLAASIREWFSVGDDVTSVESAERVDLTKVKKRAPRRTAAGASSDDEGGVAVADDSIEAKEDAPPAAPSERAAAEVGAAAPEAPEAEPVAPAAEAEPAETITQVETPAPAVEVAPPAPLAPAAADASTAESTPAAVEPVDAPSAPPAEPAPALRPAAVVPPAAPAPPKEPIRPAGPQLVPRPAVLQGPRVVRIEAPEQVRAPRPRPAAGGDSGGPGVQRVAEASGLRPKSKRTKEEEELARARSRSPRRQGGAADLVVERLREWRDQDVIERRERLASATGHGLRDRRAAERRRQSTPAGPSAPAARKAEVVLQAPILAKDFCAAIGIPFRDVHRKLLEHTGRLYTVNQSLDAEALELLVVDLGLQVHIAHPKTGLELLEEEVQGRERKHLKPRPPVVAVLGHVDHGKTSLLDAIRRTKVASGEAGGITQRIGAYRVDRGDWHVTFIDTPGHEAFTAMRARGANMTDVVVLVVAADDGMMPQTIEALNHARAANVPIVIALNKCDLPGVDFNRLYAQLAEHDLTPTEWGGNTDVIKTSATKGTGIDELIAHLSTLSELLELKADPTVPAYADVIEAQVAEGRGVVAEVLVREGTLKVGQMVVCGGASGKVRSLIDDQGRRVKDAGPGTPVEVGGLDVLPRAGDRLYVMSDAARAKAIAAEVQDARRQETLQAVRKPATLEDLLRAGKDDEVPELNLILKADGQASIDALRAKLQEFPSSKARLRLLHSGVGTVSEADVSLAHTSKAVIFGFHVVADDRARQLADQFGVEIRLYRVIYEILEDVQKALEGLLEPEKRHEARGRAEVRQIFNISRVGVVAGCAVVDGTIARSHKVRLVRDGRIVLEGASIGTLKRVKDDAREVRAGLECGIRIEGYDDVKPGDLIETYEVVEFAQKL